MQGWLPDQNPAARVCFFWQPLIPARQNGKWMNTNWILGLGIRDLGSRGGCVKR